MSPDDLIGTVFESPEQLIGKASVVGRVYLRKVQAGLARPLKLLLYGDPGVGKSAVCVILAQAMTSHATGVHHASAKEISPEMVRVWLHDIRYYPQTRWRVFVVEEIDAVSSDVETLFLQLLDRLPDHNAFLCTSNSELTNLTARFQSRTKAIRVDAPTVGEVEAFLLKHWPALGAVAHEIAEANGGDVRASLNDAQMELDANGDG